MVPGLLAVAASQGGVFTAGQARSAGYTSREIERLRRAGRWATLRRGVYAERETVDSAGVSIRARHRLDVAAALLATAPGPAWASHHSAAVLWDLEFLLPPDLGHVRLTRPGLDRSRSYQGLRLVPASLPADHQAVCDAIPLTNGARTVFDVARESAFRDAVVLADSALRKRIATKEQLQQVLVDCPTWPGIRDAGRVIAFADARSESVAESLGRVVFAEQGLPAPRLQQWIFDGAGRIGRVDFLLEEYRTIVEVDGKVKYVPSTVDVPNRMTAATQQKLGEIVWREKLREDRLREAGYEVVRVTWADLMFRPDAVRARVLAAMARAQRRWAG